MSNSRKEKMIRPFPQIAKQFCEEYAVFLRKVIDEKLSVYLNPTNIHKYEHGTTIVGKDWDGNDQNTQMKPAESTAFIRHDRVMNGNWPFFFELANSLAEPMVSSIVNSLFAEVGKAADKYGNVIDGKGAPLTADLILDAFEKVGVTISKDGKISFPQVHVDGEVFKRVQDMQLSPEQKGRYQKLLEAKVRDAMEEEQQRLSKFPVNKDKVIK